MALGQLQHLETLFVKSRWLQTHCEAFNLDNAQAIQEGTKFNLSPNLYALDTFVVTPMTTPGHCAARDQDAQQSIPAASKASSFSELVNTWGLFVHCFVSHYWGHDFSSTVKALDLWADANFKKMQCRQQQSVVFWICLFALNQHDLAEEVGENPMQGPFNAALAHASGGAVMVLDEAANPFRRIWCLFELSRLKDLGRPLELISSMGSLSQAETFGRHAAASDMLQATGEALWKISAAEAQSSVETDKHQIWAGIMNEKWRLSADFRHWGPHIFFTQSLKERQVSLTCLFTDFDRYIRSLLSNSLLQLFVERGQYVSAVQCCNYGAQFDQGQLSKICQSFATDSERRSWLNQMVMKTSSFSVTQLLLEHGADASAADEDGRSALMNAVDGAADALARLLLAHGADACAADKHGRTALMCACRPHRHFGDDTLVRLLLEHHAEAGAADKDGQTALMEAAGDVVEQTTSASLPNLAFMSPADARKRGEKVDGSTPFNVTETVTVPGNEAAVQLLLAHGADTQAANHNGHTALMGGARCGNYAVVQLLLEHGADANAADKDGCTVLMAGASGAKRVDPNPSSFMRGDFIEDKCAVVKLLLEHGADAQAANANGQTALMHAAWGGGHGVVRLLLHHGVDAGAIDHQGHTALMGAAVNDHEIVVRLLLEHGVDAGVADKDGCTAFWFACGRNRRLRRDVDAQPAYGENDTVVRLLMQHGVDAEAVNQQGDTALMAAARHGDEIAVRLLLEHGANAGAANQDDCTALWAAAVAGHDGVVRLLIEHGVDAEAVNRQGQTALMAAAWRGREGVVRLLLEHGVDAGAASNDGCTALWFAARWGHDGVVRLLMEHGVDAEAVNHQGQTALMSAAWCGHEIVVRLLLEHGANEGAANQDDCTALWAAAVAGHDGVVRLLIEHGVDAEAVNRQGQTALMAAAWRGREGVVRLLLEHGVDAGAASNDGCTALWFAARWGHDGVVRLLMEHGVDAEAVNHQGQTALMSAAWCGHEIVVRLLLEHGANHSRTALRLAARGGHNGVVSLLLEHGADAGAADSRCFTS